jgi:hypothetical protein
MIDEMFMLISMPKAYLGSLEKKVKSEENSKVSCPCA